MSQSDPPQAKNPCGRLLLWERKYVERPYRVTESVNQLCTNARPVIDITGKMFTYRVAIDAPQMSSAPLSKIERGRKITGRSSIQCNICRIIYMTRKKS